MVRVVLDVFQLVVVAAELVAAVVHPHVRIRLDHQRGWRIPVDVVLGDGVPDFPFRFLADHFHHFFLVLDQRLLGCGI